MDKIIELIKEYYYTKLEIVLVFLLCVILLITSNQTIINIIFICLLFIINLVIWLILTRSLPKNKKEIGVVLSFDYENDKQKFRIEVDFAKEIQK